MKKVRLSEVQLPTEPTVTHSYPYPSNMAMKSIREFEGKAAFTRVLPFFFYSRILLSPLM